MKSFYIIVLLFELLLNVKVSEIAETCAKWKAKLLIISVRLLSILGK